MLKRMTENYDANTLVEKKHVIKEILQEVILAGLSKTDFFNYCSFYGGTALRIFYNLDRFSEDLDFTLLEPNKDFSLDKYLKDINYALESTGLKYEINIKEKKVSSNIIIAYIKGNLKETFEVFYPNSPMKDLIIHNEKVIIKLEVDINPPIYATTEYKYRLLPFPYQIKLYDKESLFAGKIHAVIARSWKNRIKGRDLYDYIFYLQSKTKVNLKHLEARLQKTNTINKETILTKNMLVDLLVERFKSIDYENAKEDVKNFIKDPTVLNIWSSSFFIDITKYLEVV